MSKIKKAYCEDCGIKYPFGLDLILPDQQWNWIDGFDWAAPRPKEWFKKTKNV